MACEFAGVKGGLLMRHQGKTRPSSSRRSGSPARAPLVFFAVILMVSACVLMQVARHPSGKALVIETSENEPIFGDTKASVTEMPVVFPVHVDGAVQKPGVYYLPEASILRDAIQLAGGFLDSSDQSSVNLAMLVSPHMKIYVPSVGEEHPPAPIQGMVPDAVSKIDLNRASRAELETLPGVGEATSQAIVNYREQYGPFTCIEDLMNVPGIKEGRFARLEEQIYVISP
ncbi:MAG TPA: ComEA family DNA-binding protein [Clostridia bacterium]|nr:ComEA family DNA-binding protein [Clostridia bacterium]